MEHKMTFREFVKSKEGLPTPNYSFQCAFDYAVMSILADDNFPDAENDGMEIRKYIRQLQLEDERYRGSRSVLDYNNGVIRCFERLWEEYKERMKA